MPSLTFRTKLILSVFPVVAAVVIAALWMAERKFSKAQTSLFQEQFETQISTLVKSRERRSEFFGERLQKIAKQADFVSELKKGNPQHARSLIRPEIDAAVAEAMQQEARPIISSLQQALPNLGSVGDRLRLPFGKMDDRRGSDERRWDDDRRGPPVVGDERLGTKALSRLTPPSQAPLIEITDSEGNYLLKKYGRPGQEMTEQDTERARSTKLRHLGDRRLEDVLHTQEVTYFITESRDGKSEQVREVFLTPVRDPEDKTFLGALLVAFPMPTLGEQRLYEQSKRSDLGSIMSGVWVEDRLVSNTVPESQRDELAALVGRELERSSKPDRELTASIDGTRHHIIYRTLNPGSTFPPAAQVSFFSLAALDGEIADLRKNVAAFALAALGIALVLILFISRGLSGPIRELADATTEIEKGNFDVRVQARSGDEVGRLATSFNQMAAGLALQEKYRSVLNAVADRTVARELIENSSALGGELREVSVLFCDIRGFTALTETMSPAEVIDMLNEHMTALTDVAYQHGGIVDKFVGDLIMVLFGAPRSSGQDALSAVRCAWRMLAVRKELNTTSARPLEVGIGIATGTVVAGCMGSDQRLSYTVLGERVNLASRLCNIAQGGELIIDDATFTSTAPHLTTTPVPPVMLKGFASPVPCHRVSEVRADEFTALSPTSA
jgi:class 3 adenylate cyclase